METGKITPQAEDFPSWYQDVVREGDLAEVAKIVKGCMVIKPHGYAIWEKIQADLDRRFKETGHKNAYFPLLIPMSFIHKEAEHVEGFAPEIAVVTHAGGKELPKDEQYCIRPTSETIIGHFFSKWIDSYRDLPMLINQWANVMRWEMHTRMFLRTTEFLWQEGHTAHSSHEEAKEEVTRMLNVYGDFAEEVMAMPVIRGIKSDSEKFAGALQTQCIEAMMRDGKALQAGTSHDLGQNFGKAFDVKFQSEKGREEYVWQTSWGVSTRLVGGLIMTHSDDSGLILPPRLAPVQAVIVPIARKPKEKELVIPVVDKLAADLKAAGVAVKVDDREGKRPGEKYYEWERKGVPLRIELGPRDVTSGEAMTKLRVADDKVKMKIDDLAADVPGILDTFQQTLLRRALDFRKENTVTVDSWSDFKDVFADGASKFVWCHWDGTKETEAKIKEETKVTIRCIPLPGQGPAPEDGKCIYSGNPSNQRVLMSKAY
ncbi:MAG: proline--tRNA ligase [Deltaproteobacteria bacterium]|nr:proline--tRNA ligase [Deltaproteobacteria bacterium]MBN2670460.1 proline--tRNA ligase [Deltaproteobacteria bacterium]